MADAIFCRNGHFIGYEPKRDPRHEYSGVMHDWQEKQIRGKKDRLAFCSECGAAAVTECIHCKASIERDPFYRVRALYYPVCGNPYPWTETALTAAKEYTDELEALSTEEKSALKETFDELTRNTPKTQVAASRFKKFMRKLAPDAAETIRKTIVEIASETAVKLLNPGP